MIVAFLGIYRLTFGLVLLTDMTYEFDVRNTRPQVIVVIGPVYLLFPTS